MKKSSKYEIYCLTGDEEYYSLPFHDVKTKIDFGKKYLGADFDFVILNDIDWLFWCMEVGIITIPMPYLIKMESLFSDFSKIERKWIPKIIATSISGGNTDDLMDSILMDEFPSTRNTIWGAIFKKYFGKHLAHSKRARKNLDMALQVNSDTFKAIYKVEGKFLKNVSLSILCPEYPEYARLLEQNGIGYFFVCPLKAQNDLMDSNKIDMIVSEYFSMNELLKIVSFLNKRINSIQIHYNGNFFLAIRPRIKNGIGKDGRLEDISAKMTLNEFLLITEQEKIIKTGYDSIFPNENPSIEWESRSENYETDDSHDDSHKQLKQLIKESNQHFYDEFGGFFHEDML